MISSRGVQLTWRMAVHRVDVAALDEWVDVAALALRLIRKAPRTWKYVAITEYPLVGGFRCIFFSVLLLFWLIQVKFIWVWWYQLSVVTIVIYDLIFYIFWYRRISQAFLSICQYQPLGVRSTGDSTGHTWADAGTCLGDSCWLARQEPHQTTKQLQFYLRWYNPVSKRSQFISGAGGTSFIANGVFKQKGNVNGASWGSTLFMPCQLSLGTYQIQSYVGSPKSFSRMTMTYPLVN